MPICGQAFDGRFARLQDALLIAVLAAVRALDDLIGKLTVDGSAEPVHI
jgi:hypothetical protein